MKCAIYTTYVVYINISVTIYTTVLHIYILYILHIYIYVYISGAVSRVPAAAEGFLANIARKSQLVSYKLQLPIKKHNNCSNPLKACLIQNAATIKSKKVAATDKKHKNCSNPLKACLIQNAASNKKHKNCSRP